MAVVILVAQGLILVAAFALSVNLLIVAFKIVAARARRKGYRIGAWVLVGLGAVIGLATFAGSLPVAAMAEEHPFLFLCLIPVAPVVAASATMFAVLWLLPRRQVRIFGSRKGGHRMIIAGWITIVAGSTVTVIPMIAALWPPESTEQMLGIAGILASAVLLWFVVGWMGLIVPGRTAERQPALEEVLARDARAPVLYLRPFENDGEMFVGGPSVKYGRYKQGYVIIRQNVSVGMSLEEFLGPSIQKHIGPFVALGSPQDFLNPVGAARLYAKDETWQQDFERLARTASAMIMDVGKSENVRWELEKIRREGWHERLYLVTHHPSLDLLGQSSRTLSRLKGTTITSWETFANTLTELGYHIDALDPGAGAVVCFDEAGHSVVLTSGADLPHEYVDRISARAVGEPRQTRRDPCQATEEMPAPEP